MGPWTVGFWFFPIIMVLAAVLFLCLLYVIAGRKYFCRGSREYYYVPRGIAEDTPVNIIEKRYAKGEITKEEYERLKRELRGRA